MKYGYLIQENPQVTRLIKPQIFLQVALSPIQTSCFIIIGNRDEILKFLETHSKVPIIITTTTTTDKNISQVGIEISISPYNKKPIGPTALGTSTSFNWIKVLLPNTKWCLEIRYDESTLQFPREYDNYENDQFEEEIINGDEKSDEMMIWAENVKIWYFNLGITLGEVKEVIEKESWFW
ncbi:10684_t:CDS:2 [Diversispora eburnea]|uniref:10684_t:CDS:1 n=1 Tax=Diversispora eburnea TaxID=1213867 RepID=A0A9N8WK69_9GLOM|nr:10684_t:CDS:2 [Diversispora eburnea]